MDLSVPHLCHCMAMSSGARSSILILSESVHPNLNHPGQLYRAAQARGGATLPRIIAGDEQGQLSSSHAFIASFPMLPWVRVELALLSSQILTWP